MRQQSPVRATVIVDNYNYERYVGQAIESALAQSYEPLEVVVVDDGSADGSVEAIKHYGDRVIPVFKPNGGQASAFNAAFEHSSGEVIVFLDADDLLLEDAVADAVAAMANDVSKVHWPLWEIDEHGDQTGGIVDPELPEGDFRELVRRLGPGVEDTWPNAATSGNAWSREFLAQALPMPELLTGVDIYLSGLAAALGRFVTLPEPRSLYRLHGLNLSGELSFERMLALGTELFEEQSRELASIYRSKGVDFDPSGWWAHAWYPRIAACLNRLEALLAPGEPFILVDDDSWGTDEIVRGHPRIPLPEKDGEYTGTPEDEGVLVEQLRRRQAEGVRVIAFAWNTFWWPEYYRELAAELDTRWRLEHSDKHLRVFSAVA